MSTAYKLVYGPWTSSFRVYVDYGSTDFRDGRALNYNDALVCEPGTEIVTNDFDTVTYGTASPVDELVGFEAWIEPARICQVATHRNWWGSGGYRPHMIEKGMHIVTLDFDPDFDLEGGGYLGDSRRVHLLRADVVDELDLAEIETFAGRPAPVPPDGLNYTGPYPGGAFYGLT